MRAFIDFRLTGLAINGAVSSHAARGTAGDHLAHHGTDIVQHELGNLLRFIGCFGLVPLDKRRCRRFAVGNRGRNKGHAKRTCQVVALTISGFSAFQWLLSVWNRASDGRQPGDVVLNAEAKLLAHILQLTRLELGGDIRKGGVTGLREGLAKRNTAQRKGIVVGHYAAIDIHSARARNDGIGI